MRRRRSSWLFLWVRVVGRSVIGQRLPLTLEDAIAAGWEDTGIRHRIYGSALVRRVA